MNEGGEGALDADVRVERRENYTRRCESLRNDHGEALLSGPAM